ncbi:alcohol dehydrogenase catalytic domain-containing protein [Herbaspirillum sp. WKF16]|uniref:alcohol dehydrogenase catalytic domain-containing protein n=1 Tax=Herbaspirillum sp. WKF16 TaxID=3028312 RepID=UPI0023A949B6|nr:alcohol dehydrogenase catalytic domain-containing protein [Herbaspirillum sp. WKF16]WDZ94111.1 alcohol dehydrogenase catalytic domain-containing protein [Herbaspirillum sp. WKF16]
MRAVVFNSGHDIRVEHVSAPVIDLPDDIIVRVTAAALGGVDLHIYRGQISGLKERDVLGREFMGIVEEAGPAVSAVKVGDRVAVPSVIACGKCFFCRRKLYSACEISNFDRSTLMNEKVIRSGAAFFGYGHFHGGLPGGQAELVRVPRANSGPLALPEQVSDDQAIFLSDALPTAYQAAINAAIRPGDTLVIFGAGPIGQLCAACARAMDVGRIYMVDRHDYLLRFASDNYDVIPINFCSSATERFVVEHTGYRGADCVIDAVGFEAGGSPLETALAAVKLEGGSSKVLRHAIATVRRGGHISVAGTYQGLLHGFPFGEIFEKNITLRAGRTNVQEHLPTLLDWILEKKIRPEIIVSHHLDLEEAPRAYNMANGHLDERRKIVLVPGLNERSGKGAPASEQ